MNDIDQSRGMNIEEDDIYLDKKCDRLLLLFKEMIDFCLNTCSIHSS